MSGPMFGNILHGMPVVIVQPVQRMRLSEKVPVTDEFRAEINAWMAGFFGFEDPLQGKVLVHTDPWSGRKTIMCSPAAAKALKDSHNG